MPEARERRVGGHHAVELAAGPQQVVAADLAQGKSATQSSTYPGIASAAASSAVDGNTDGKFFDDVKYELEIVDRLGGGDSFSAGFIYGYLAKKTWGDAVRYGNAFGALKHTNPGDFNWASLSDVESLLKGGSLRVAR